MPATQSVIKGNAAFDANQCTHQMRERGYYLLENVFDTKAVQSAKTDLKAAIAEEWARYGNQYNLHEGMVLLCALYGKSFVNILDHSVFMAPFETLLGEGCIIYAYTSSSMPPNGTNYSSRIHVDCPRLIPNYITNMGAILILDDFTLENGATWFLPASHVQSEPPTEDYFYANAERLVAKAGSVMYFNARLWHAGGTNQTDQWRHAITLNMCRPYMKQRLDIPKAMSHLDLSHISDKALQKLGFHSQVPESYEEYYAPQAFRKYKQRVE
jgi:ectoine hydroxylase-related dioxygenase (phytanoyl-CoA dioxygenase family)